MKIFLTGASGFVGQSIIRNFKSGYFFNQFVRDTKCNISDEFAVFHFAGKTHDLKKVLVPDEYYKVNTELTKEVFDAFLISKSKVFITLSSVKAIADYASNELLEDDTPHPLTEYGKSKLLAEKYILSKPIPYDKRVYILRPCMIHGPGDKSNLFLLYKLVSKNIPWPLGDFENLRSFCSIDNLIFIIKELMEREDIPSGVYNVADDEPISTNEIIRLIAQFKSRKSMIWNIPKRFIGYCALLGDKFFLPINSERLQKLTSSYVVSNKKIKNVLGKSLPLTSREGLLKTFQSYK